MRGIYWSEATGSPLRRKRFTIAKRFAVAKSFAAMKEDVCCSEENYENKASRVHRGEAILICSEEVRHSKDTIHHAEGRKQ